MMNILYVQFSDTSTVRAIVTLTSEIQLIKVPVLPSSLTLIKHRSVLCVKMIYYPVITFFFFFWHAFVWASDDMIMSPLLTNLMKRDYSESWQMSVLCNIHYSCLLLFLLIKTLKEVATIIQQASSPRSSPTTQLSCPDELKISWIARISPLFLSDQQVP